MAPGSGRARGAVRVAAGEGGLTPTASRRVQETVQAAMRRTGLVFSVFVGDVVEALPDEAKPTGENPPVSESGTPAAAEHLEGAGAPRGGGGLRATAERLHAALGESAPKAVLVLVAPGERRLEIVTGTDARRRVDDQKCSLAALSMVTAFAGGNIAGGLVQGISQLADAAGEQRG